ncbi:uncharacterized protein LOC129615932 [Condylostylus longicornis]|uniref:uncharacterized protein LOC129615932 n=1 Tax=Condylostylus longicornis TaxID=2530218 RepID=UPI00244DF186|nr:uncharacterized protein LOC129615932 [Condylostylus longicornis]
MNFTMKLYSIVIFLIIVIFNNNYSLAINCIECDNSDKNCTTAPEFITKNVACDLEKGQQCYVQLEADGTIKRGCASDDFCKDNTDNCVQCKDNNGENIPCNVQILPKTRPKCYVCKGSDCLKVDEKKTKIEYCQYLNKSSNLHCFTKTVNQDVTRGCLAKSGIQCDTSDCKNCTNTDNDKPCNNDDGQINDKFSCYECRSDAFKECEEPEKNKQKVDKKECKNPIEGCFAERWAGITFRGCAEILEDSEKAKCLENKNGCLICKNETLCNGKVFNSAIINSISTVLLITCAFITKKLLN